MAAESLKNWAGNIAYGTQRIYSARSREEARVLIRAESRVKVLGTRHCFNRIADSEHAFLSLREMDQVVAFDAVARTVTVEAGMSYGQLCPYLEARGFALPNLASLPHISVAGACSTGTHGSGVGNGTLATAASGLELVTAEGEVVTLTRAKDGDEFLGAVVGLGALGAITQVTLDLELSYQMRQYVYENLPMAEVRNHFDAIAGAAYSVSLFTDWQKGRINEVWVKSRLERGSAFAGGPEFFGARRASRNLHPIAEMSPINCTEQMGVPGPWYDRLPHFRMGFTPSAGQELQSEYFVPHAQALEAIAAVEKLREQVGPHLLTTEIRFVAADNLWLSPCYRRPSVTIHFTWKPDWAAVRQLLPVIERELAPFSPRPHWGKLFTLAPEQVRSRYERLPEFVALARKYDPRGKFRNAFLDAYVFGTGAG